MVTERRRADEVASPEKKLEAVQIRPPRSEEIALQLEKYAAEAREGLVTGYNGILIRPGGGFTMIGWDGRDANAFEQIGMLVSMIVDTVQSTNRTD
jgi:hypothetical protein